MDNSSDNNDHKQQLDLITKLVPLYTLEGPILHQVYLDLVIVKRWYLIQPRETNGLCYLEGKETASSPAQVIFPLSARKTIKVDELFSLFSKLQHKTTIESGQNATQQSLSFLTLGIVDSDSTISYYRIHEKLVPPTE
eukprot:TRINITY_DN1325_c0_g1_i4.p1 TRINITY_DN1325_c0_g1~~TRINITY_DN1325_c0_g1_i4.p1  ORF type:complete len:138 (-),score=31.75 TRINITY_DN1325_c0_g1_i4:487-900(-)